MITIHQYFSNNEDQSSCDEGSYQLLNERVFKIELNDGQQEKASTEDRNEISQLRGRVAQLEDLVANVISTPETEKDDVTNRPIKRPARLLPFQFLL